MTLSRLSTLSLNLPTHADRLLWGSLMNSLTATMNMIANKKTVKIIKNKAILSRAKNKTSPT